MSDNYHYKIMLFRRNEKPRVVRRGLSLEEAQLHCRKSSTHGDGWFHGYTRDA
jgi:hypothetical protein